MSSLKPFQLKTVKRALRALSGNGPRRFLVADEVGLGKTLVARDVVRRLAKRVRREQERPLVVFYLCSNLAIGHQNRTRFAELDGLVPTDVDRLTLVPTRQLDDPGASVHFYSLTANTSFPDRKGRSRAGTVKERALLHNLLAAINRHTIKDDWLRGRRVTSGNWPSYLRRSSAKPPADLLRRFRLHLLKTCEAPDARGISPALKAWRKAAGDLEVTGKLRKLLAQIALETVEPDLVVLDEFQRFRDLMHLDEGGAGRVAQLLLSPVNHSPPGVLLLSATPYKAYDSPFEEIFGDRPHHEQLLDLYGWLEGGGKRGKSRRKKLKGAFRAFGDALRHAPVSAVTQERRDAVQRLLRRRIARTERYQHPLGQRAAPPPESLAAPLEAVDLVSFRHAADSLAPLPGARSYQWCAVPYWRSVPLPMQSLGGHYKAWKTAHRAGTIQKHPPHAGLSAAQRNQYRGPEVWPHPQLRAMLRAYPPETLTIPWVAPSRTWWPLAGPWSDGGPRKALVFSRFLAVPRALSTLMSFAAEQHLFDKASDEVQNYPDTVKQRPLHFGFDAIALFHPSEALIAAVDPASHPTFDAARGAARATLATTLDPLLEVSETATTSRPLATLLVLVEAAQGRLDQTRSAWLALAKSVSKTREGATSGQHTLAATLRVWFADSGPGPYVISPAELDRLALAALDLPGVVLARAIRRHWPAADAAELLSTSWQGLRAYLNNPWFAERLNQTYGTDRDPIAAEARYAAHLRKAVRDGSLEVLLDEHLHITRTLRGAEGAKLCKTLRNALVLRIASPTLHEPPKTTFTLRAHAAMPFSDGVSVARPGEEEREVKARANELRSSFNSPFWPHILVTTSVGQEGLDFHVWCDTLAHWDLPSNPVDLEQREGRINRFGGLAIRRALAQHPPLADHNTWTELAAAAEKLADDTGLSPWWLFDTAQVTRQVFDVPTSEATRAFADLQRRRMLYRLALGQPDQDSFVRALPDDLSPEQLRQLTIHLG